MAYMIAENDRARLTIEVDEVARNPREGYEPLGTLVYQNDRSWSGDKDALPGRSCTDVEDYLYRLAGRYGMATEDPTNKQVLAFLEKHLILCGVDIYEHSSRTFKMNADPKKLFDCEGIMYVEKEAVRKEWGVKRISKQLRETVLRNFESEIKEYAAWAEGEVYGFILEEKQPCHCGQADCEDVEWKEIDSCWGFYGDEWHQNGLADYIPDEYKDLIDKLHYE